MYGILIFGLADGRPTPHANRWLKEYDHRRNGMRGHIVTTANPKEAMRFATMADAHECWKAAHGIRPDGRPNRPLTAFSVEIKQVNERVPVS